MSAETWRVVAEGGEVRSAAVAYDAAGPWPVWTAVTDAAGDDYAGHARTARAAVLALAHLADWPVAEIVAPGALTAAERVADAAENAAENRAISQAIGPRFDETARAVAVAAETERCIAALRARQEECYAAAKRGLAREAWMIEGAAMTRAIEAITATGGAQ